jgi:predicted nucleic acid-binding protein
MTVAAIVDTNILVYRFDRRDLRKQHIADVLLRRGLAANTLHLPHQAIVEFVAVASKRTPPFGRAAALREAAGLIDQFPILYPDASVLRTALRGVVEHQLSWFDAHLWAYAETYGIAELLSEDFQHGRVYGSVRAIDPFR